MRKKYFIIITVFLLAIATLITSVRAAEEVSDREMAIACALSYVPLRENKTMAQNFDLGNIKLVSNVVNFVNAKFNLHNFADIHEIDDWKVVDYHSKFFSEKSFAAFVLQKDNNLIIAIRGTDTEALADVKYGLKNYHNQEEYAEKYVLEIMDKYSKKNENYNIYIAGHSLGGYLAQTAGAKVAQNIEKYPNLNLVRIVDFNGIGMNFLTYLGEKYNYGNQAQTIETLKQLGEEGKLVEYYTYGDVVSALGVHYGEMRMMLPSIDSVSYHRTNYRLLGNLNKQLKIAQKLDKIVKEDKFNAFKTEIYNAKELYKLNDSLVAYLNLTHEADTFACIDMEKSPNKAQVKIVEVKNVLSTHVEEDTDFIETKKDINIKAITTYGSAKKYEWYENGDKDNWILIKTSTIDPNDPAFNANEDPTNILEIDIDKFQKGETKVYKVISYYDDNYTSSKYHYNEAKREYEYVEDETKSKKNEPKIVENTIKIKREAEKTGVLSNAISRLKSLFKR